MSRYRVGVTGLRVSSTRTVKPEFSYDPHHVIDILVLPEMDSDPPNFVKRLVLAQVSPTIAFELRPPPFAIVFWQGPVLHAPMPEAPIDEDGNFGLR